MKQLFTCYRDKFVEGEKIPLLNDALNECLNNEQRIIIDIKDTRIEIVQTVLDAYKKYPKLFQRAVVSCFNPIVIYMVIKKKLQMILINVKID